MSDVEPRVRHHPDDHPYVRHLGFVATTSATEPVWDVDALVAEGVQVVHLHFGFEHLSPSTLLTWLDQLHDAGISLVHTVHDLDNPHLVDQRPYHQLVELIMDAAACVLTLTPTAAGAVRSRYGRQALVVPHPHVVPLDVQSRFDIQPAPTRNGVFVHAATLRPNLDIDLIGRLARAAGPVGGLHVHVRDTAPAPSQRRLIRLATATGATVDVGPRLTDDELWRRLAHARVVALPYRWGTHSGLLEAAHDLGTPTAAPGFGGYADQGATPLDDHDLAGSLGRAASTSPTVTVAGRRRAHLAVAAVHRQAYRNLVRIDA